MTPPFPPRFSADGFSDDEVDRFLAGKSAPDELARFRDYLSTCESDAAWAAVLARYELASDAAFDGDLRDGSAEALFRSHLSPSVVPPAWHPAASVAASVAASETPVQRVTARPVRTDRRGPGFAVALRSGRGTVAARWWAAGALAATVIVGVVTTQWMATRRSATAAAVTYTAYTTQSGQIAHMVLGDGTRVTLAPNTTLGVSRTFAASRDVTVSGQAYFDVASATHAPFVVRTGNVVTRVLGTSFDVRRYTNDKDTRVVVLSGKVAVFGRQGVTLAAGGVGRVTDSTASATTAGDAERYVAWTTGGLMTFRDVPASELLDVLEHWYGVEFRVTDSSVVRDPIVAQLMPGETRADALKLVQKVLGVTMSFGKTSAGTDVITLTPKGAERHVAPLSRGARVPLPPHVQEVGR